jgi:hypothetical protein
MKKTIIAIAAVLMTSGAVMAQSDHNNVYISGPDRSTLGPQVSNSAIGFDYASKASVAHNGPVPTSFEQERQKTIDMRASNGGRNR